VSRTLRRAMIVLAVLGVGLTIYLTYVHYAGIKPACTSGQSCLKVQTSVWSKVDGVPVALLGLIGDVLILGTLLAPDREESRVATLGLTVIGVGFSAYLTYRELFSIQYFAQDPGSGWVGDAHSSMRPYVSGQAYQNYIDPGLRGWQHAYYGANYPRLQAIRRHVDPHHFFNFPQAIGR